MDHGALDVALAKLDAAMGICSPRKCSPTIMRVAMGNPGALRVLHELCALDAAGAERLEMLGYKGPDVWRLYKNQCGENLAEMLKVMAELEE